MSDPIEVIAGSLISIIATIEPAGPTWTAQISWAQSNLGGPVSANDILQCYPTNCEA